MIERIAGVRGTSWIHPTPHGMDIDELLARWDAARLEVIEDYITERQSLREQKSWPEREIEMATVNTVYIPLYRVHAKEHFLAGKKYPENWQPSERKKVAEERFSPLGAEGFYFGLTLAAAENEARYYGGGTVNEKTRMILVLVACFDRILHLPICIQAVWSILGLAKPAHPMEMLLATMDRSAGNRPANEIGKWAREQGFAGMIYPSARYSDASRLDQLRAEGKTIIPEINFIYIGSHLCRNRLALIAHWPIVDLYQQAKGIRESVRLWTEPNLVVFDGERLMGNPWGVVYETYSMAERREALHWDDPRRQIEMSTFTFEV